MNNYSLEKLKVIESYIENYINDLEDDILENRSDIVMTIDWREDDSEMMCAELAGDFHLGDSRQLTDKSLLPFDLVS